MPASQIARGGSGPVVLTPVTPSIPASPPFNWQINSNYQQVASSYASNGWAVDVTSRYEAHVTPPANAVGYYTLMIWPAQSGGSGYGDTRSFGDFEIVCLTVSITATEIYRDENVYRFSCTATPQGGTAPYSYSWSGSIGTVISGQGTATLVVEVPVGGIGQIGVGVTDSSNPQCSASDSFSVCGLTCDFSAVLVEAPPLGTTGSYIYECQASAAGSAMEPYTYKWTPTPQSTSDNGRIAHFSFPDDQEYSISLTVTDAMNCQGFKTKTVGGYELTVSTTPSDFNPDNKTGTRGTTEFKVVVEGIWRGDAANAPAQVNFELVRPAVSSVPATVPGLRVEGSSPPKYQWEWNVTQTRGKWFIKVQGYRSSTATFKINKRQQIVLVAQSWAGATKGEANAAGVSYCNDFVARIYGHVGLPIAATVDPQYEGATTSCSGDGCLLFFNIMEGPEGGPYIPRSPWNPQHVAIQDGGQRINADSLTQPYDPNNLGLPNSGVAKEDWDAGVATNPPDYDPDIHVRSTVNLDED